MANYGAVSAAVFTVNVLTFTALIFSKKSEPNEKIECEIISEKNSVWMVAPLTRDEEFLNTAVKMANTTMGFTLSCVPNMKARKQCDELAKAVGKESLHYVELMMGANRRLLGSYCTSDLSHIPYHIKHVCNYQYCTDDICVRVYVFDIRVVEEGTPEEVCRTIAFRLTDKGPVVHKFSKCDTKYHEPDDDSVMKECRNKVGRIPTPAQNTWIVEEDLDLLCKVEDIDHS